MRLKRAQSLVLTLGEQSFSVYNCVAKAEFECDGNVLSFLTKLDRWTGEEEARSMASELSLDVDGILEGLFAVQAVVWEDSAEAAEEAQFCEQWKWGLPSALLHRTVTGRAVASLDDQIEFQTKKLADDGAVALVHQVPAQSTTIMLTDPDIRRGALALFEKRRTVRDGTPFELGYDELSTVLYAGFGVTEWIDNGIVPLPLKYAPSGGARNPFDAYVHVESVEGLDPGTYRYLATQHALEPLDTEEHPPIPDLLGGQSWAKNAACLIVLVAEFSRSMWKYEGDDNAYRVVLIEAGHIGQNVMVTAASLGLSACASAALDHTLMERLFGIDSFDASPIYALAVNRPPN